MGVIGWQCVVCDATIDIGQPLHFRCPNWSLDEPHHVLRIIRHDEPLERVNDDVNPFVAFLPYLAWASAATALGMSTAEQVELVRATDARIAAVAGTGFTTTPFLRADALSNEMGYTDDGGVWIKDETGNVAGSHKGRHLFTTLLHLLSAEAVGAAPWRGRSERPPLAIASCGNAALAAATLAAAEGWPIHVFVPPTAQPAVIQRLETLAALVTVCPRLATDPAGDPSIFRFREAIRDGALPFSVQGPDNAWCLDGGRTIGWEMAPLRADHVFIQVGGGALARCTIGALAQAGPLPKLHAVQTEGCAPLARAWKRVLAGPGGIDTAPARWRECMTPWDNVASSAADGILDDETYDGLGLVIAMNASHGAPVIAKEAEILRANDVARQLTGIDASHTGTAGLAGLMAIRDVISSHHRVALIFSGAAR